LALGAVRRAQGVTSATDAIDPVSFLLVRTGKYLWPLIRHLMAVGLGGVEEWNGIRDSGVQRDSRRFSDLACCQIHSPRVDP